MRNVHLLLLHILFGSAMGLAANETLLPVEIQDSSGKSPAGIEQSAFAVKAKGVSLEAVDYVEPWSGHDPKQTPVFVLFDAVSVPPPFQGVAEEKLLAFLQNVADENLRVTLVINTQSGLVIVHELTTPNGALKQALERLSDKTRRGQSNTTDHSFGSPEDPITKEVGRLEALTRVYESAGNIANLPTTFKQLAGLQQLANALQNSGKRKSLVWITAMFPVQVIDSRIDFNSFTPEKMPELKQLAIAYQAAVNAMNSAHISIYPFQVQEPTPPDPIFSYAQSTHYGLQQLAKRTGGFELQGSLGLGGAVGQVQKSSSPYYLLKLQAIPRKHPEWNPVKITLRDPTWQIRSSDGFFALP